MSEIKWSKEKLIDLGEFARGRSKHRPRNDKLLFENGKYPLVQTGDIRKANLYIYKSEEFYNDKGLKQSKLWPTDTLCITIAANIAETALLGRPMCFPDSIVGFNAYPKKSNNLFVHYVFELLKQQIQSNVNGSIQKNINIEFLQNFELMVPPLEYQNKISELLKNIDQKIANNDAISKELESMAKTIYDYWFLQFEFPDKDGKPYKSNGGKMVWNDQLKQEIPEGWQVDNLYKIADFINGIACQKYRPLDNKHKLPVIKITEMHDGFTSKTEFVRDSISEDHIIKNGDILFSWSASLETMIWNYGKGGLNQHIFKVIPKNGFSLHYVYQTLSSYIINFKRMAEARKTTMGHITQDHLKQSEIMIPPQNLINKFENVVRSFYDKITMVDEESQELKSLRDFLLPLLMNGQVTIED